MRLLQNTASMIIAQPSLSFVCVCVCVKVEEEYICEICSVHSGVAGDCVVLGYDTASVDDVLNPRRWGRWGQLSLNL